MDFWLEALHEAVGLVRRMDSDLLGAIWISIKVSTIAVVIAALVGVPAGFIIGIRRFRGRRVAVLLVNTSMAVPTVVVGLVVYSFISNSGPLGGMRLLFTQWAMVIGQALLAAPVLAAFTLAAVESADPRIVETARTLGAGRMREALAVLSECKAGVVAAVAAGFGRVFAEVGVSMMLGGNIKGLTRNITTAIALESSMGKYAMGIVLGAVLLLVALAINAAVQLLRYRGER